MKNRRTLLLLALRNATRKPLRTVLTAGMVVAGTFMLVLSLSWLNGIFSTMLRDATNAVGHLRVVTPGYAEREALMPIYENIADAEPVLAALRAQPAVEAAYPKVQTGVTVSVGEEIGDVFGLAVGAPREYFTERLDADANLVEGRWLDDGAEELVLGWTLAEEAGARLGDEVILLGTTQDGALSPLKGELVGIVRAGHAMQDRAVFLSLERARWLTDIPGGAVEILVFTDDDEPAPERAAELRQLPELAGYEVQAWSEREPWQQILPMINGIWAMLVFVIVFLAAMGVWNTMMMSVLERTAEIGVLRAMGLGRLGAVGLFVFEATAIAVLGGLVGVALGALPSWYLSVHGIELAEEVTQNFSGGIPLSTTFKAALSWETMITSFALGLVMAFLGSLLPAIRASLIQPVTAMRSGR